MTVNPHPLPYYIFQLAFSLGVIYFATLLISEGDLFLGVLVLFVSYFFVKKLTKRIYFHYQTCIWCLEARSNCGASCPAKIRNLLQKSERLPKPDGFLDWDMTRILDGTHLGLEDNLQSKLKSVRDGRFGFQLVELFFNGKKDPQNGQLIESDGNSEPDAWQSEDRNYRYEVKSITANGLSIAMSNELGQDRNINPNMSNEAMALSVECWIFVDRTLLVEERHLFSTKSMPYFFIEGEILAQALSGEKFINPLTGKTNQRMSSNRRTTYVGALQLLHSCQTLRDELQVHLLRG